MVSTYALLYNNAARRVANQQHEGRTCMVMFMVITIIYNILLALPLLDDVRQTLHITGHKNKIYLR